MSDVKFIILLFAKTNGYNILSSYFKVIIFLRECTEVVLKKTAL